MKKIKDYVVITGAIETDFWGNILPNQNNFNRLVKEKIKQGYVPFEGIKSDSGTSGGLFSTSHPATLSQAMVLYEE